MALAIPTSATESDHSTPPGRKWARSNALQLGPRKKSCAIVLTLIFLSEPTLHQNFSGPLSAPWASLWQDCPHLLQCANTHYEWSSSHVWWCSGRRELDSCVRCSFSYLVDFSDFSHSERKECTVFRKLLRSVPGLEDWFMSSSEEEVIQITDLVRPLTNDLCIENSSYMSLQIQKGASGARADDTKGMKAAIIDWITPKGQSLTPHIPRNVKSGCGFHHDRTGALLCPAGLNWNNSA